MSATGAHRETDPRPASCHAACAFTGATGGPELRHRKSAGTQGLFRIRSARSICIANILSRRKSALRVTVEIWPSGDKTRAHAIANFAHVRDLAEVSDYAVSAGQEYNPLPTLHLGRGTGIFFSMTATTQCGRSSQRSQPGQQKSQRLGDNQGTPAVSRCSGSASCWCATAPA